MNAKQMKNAVSRFRKADVSIIKDEKLRAKAHKLQAKQTGFTLLELLVVITLLATLATAALVAYDGIGENASDAAAANALISAESAVRNFRAVESRYPNQWDNLANADAVDTSGALQFLADETQAFFGKVTIDASGALWPEVAESLEESGIDELQSLVSTSTFDNDVVPNLAFNESSPSNTADAADELQIGENGEVTYDGGNITAFDLSIVPSGGDGGPCTFDGVSIAATFDGTVLTDSATLNLINDSIDDDACALVLALGYGKDVPGTTIDSNVAIAQVPTTGTTNINPNESYARAIALFQVAIDEDEDGAIDEVFDKPRLIGFVDPEGRAIDTVLAAANSRSEAEDDD
jgi:prepilin-type N-terminal cleavage/methylation domain-containing protein